MANLYYVERGTALAVGATVEIGGEEGRHAVRVSRLRVGERILLGDGAGAIGGGVVVRTDRDRFAVELDEVRTDAEASPRVTLVQALAKGDRDERAVEQATEFGVDRVLPWQAARSVSRWDGAGGAEKAAKGVAKWARIAREASKQSLRARIPEVGSPISSEELRAAAADPDRAVIALHPRGGRTLSEWAARFAAGAVRAAGASAAAEASRPSEILLVVGPEGGFSDAELDALESAGAEILVLGTTVLRTSSAGPAGLAVLNVALGRW